jgi:hypothetical protein
MVINLGEQDSNLRLQHLITNSMEIPIDVGSIQSCETLVAINQYLRKSASLFVANTLFEQVGNVVSCRDLPLQHVGVTDVPSSFW